MTDNGYEIGGVRFEHGELFALGAAAGALVTAAISEYLERRQRPVTQLEQAKAAEADALEAATDSAEQARTVVAKRRQQAGKEAARQADRLREVAAEAIGAAATGGLADKVRDLAGEVQSRGVTLKDQLLENYESLRDGTEDATLGARVQQASETAAGTIRTVAQSAADTLRDYTGTARERLADSDLPDRAREYSSTVTGLVKEYVDVAGEKLRDAKLGERARDYSTTVKDAVETARGKLSEAELSERAKTVATAAGATIASYGVQAADVTRRTAREGASKLGEGATNLAQATSEQAAEVRYGVQKGVKRTRLRARWGLRALLVGVAVGVLAAPQSGNKTREALSSFVQNFLDVLMPDDGA